MPRIFEGNGLDYLPSNPAADVPVCWPVRQIPMKVPICWSALQLPIRCIVALSLVSNEQSSGARDGGLLEELAQPRTA
jgi:hypothetical protein